MRSDAKLKPRPPVFVFGSNEAGRHGKGAAKYAREYRGAEDGVGEGFRGNSYAIPTKDKYLFTRSLPAIEKSVLAFKDYAEAHPYMTFEVTPVGCGLAGYKQEQIKPFFEPLPSNCFYSKDWVI
jgi:hypothetical protein